MSLGTGLFFGCLFLGTVFLYLRTRDTWNWRKVWKSLALATGVVVLAIVALVGGWVGYERWGDRPQLVIELKGVVLGERLSDVIFRHGEYTRRKSDTADDVRENYLHEERRILLEVKDGKVVSAMYLCKESGDYSTAGGISCGDEGAKILDRFGDQVQVLCSKDEKYMRIYEAAIFRVRYFLVRDKVDTLVVTTDRMGAVGKWQPCT